MKIVIIIVLTMLIARCYGPMLLSDMAMKSECKKDGGIKIYSSISAESKEVPSTHPKLVKAGNQRREADINQDFKYVQTYTYWTSHGYVIYRDVDSVISKNGDTIAENIVYIRQGSPELPGTICPEAYLRPDQFYNAVFQNVRKAKI